jgi:hypothetical protein
MATATTITTFTRPDPAKCVLSATKATTRTGRIKELIEKTKRAVNLG